MIEDVINGIDTNVSALAEGTYGALAGDLAGLVLAMGTLGFLILCANMLLQVVPLHGGALVAWGIRFIIVSSAATSWAFFSGIYDAVTSVPDGIAALLLGGETLAAGLQETVDTLFASAETMTSAAGRLDVSIHLTALLIRLIGIILLGYAVDARAY